MISDVDSKSRLQMKERRAERVGAGMGVFSEMAERQKHTGKVSTLF